MSVENIPNGCQEVLVSQASLFLLANQLFPNMAAQFDTPGLKLGYVKSLVPCVILTSFSVYEVVMLGDILFRHRSKWNSYIYMLSLCNFVFGLYIVANYMVLLDNSNIPLLGFTTTDYFGALISCNTLTYVQMIFLTFIGLTRTASLYSNNTRLIRVLCVAVGCCVITYIVALVLLTLENTGITKNPSSNISYSVAALCHTAIEVTFCYFFAIALYQGFKMSNSRDSLLMLFKSHETAYLLISTILGITYTIVNFLASVTSIPDITRGELLRIGNYLNVFWVAFHCRIVLHINYDATKSVVEKMSLAKRTNGIVSQPKLTSTHVNHQLTSQPGMQSSKTDLQNS